MGASWRLSKGWKEVSARSDWACRRLAKSETTKLNLKLNTSRTAGGRRRSRLHGTIERGGVVLWIRTNGRPWLCAPPNFSGKENGSWKLLHRHADPLIGKTAPATVLQK